VPRATLNRWRTQPRAPLVATVKRVAERLGLDYVEALELAGVTRPSEIEAEVTREQREAQATLAERIDRLSGDGRRLVERVVKALEDEVG
jgi:hypothetical protein